MPLPPNPPNRLKPVSLCVMKIEIGSLVVVTRSTAICDEGEVGVCYELYGTPEQPGYGFIFERGGYDGFSPEDVNVFLEVTGVVLPSIASYAFENVGQLRRDFRQGRFVEAFGARAQA